MKNPSRRSLFSEAAAVAPASRPPKPRPTTLELLDQCLGLVRQRHLERMRELLPIGAALDAQQLRDWIAIGRGMAAQGRGFMA